MGGLPTFANLVANGLGRARLETLLFSTLSGEVRRADAVGFTKRCGAEHVRGIAPGRERFKKEDSQWH